MNYTNLANGALVVGTSGDDYIKNSGFDEKDNFHYADNSTLIGGAGNDSLRNYEGRSIKIDGGTGDDSIHSGGRNNLILGGANDDFIDNYGVNVRVNGGAGNDSISSYWEFCTITIDAGSGDDSIVSGGSNSSLNGGADNDYIWNVALQWNDGAGSNETIDNTNVTILGGSGNDTLKNNGSQVTVFGGSGNDEIYNEGSKVTIDAGEDERSVGFDDNGITVYLEQYYNYIVNRGGNDVEINALFGDNNYVYNYEGQRITIKTGDSADHIGNYISGTSLVTINAGNGNNTIENYGDAVSIVTGNDNDDIKIFDGNNITLEVGGGKNTIDNNGSMIKITAGKDSDYIKNVCSHPKSDMISIL